MIPVVGMFRGLFLGSILVWYSNSVWKTMDNYYNQEFKKYLQKEKEERRFPTEEEVCRAVPNAPCTESDADANTGDAVAAATAATHADAEGVAAKASRAEALGANTAPLTDATRGHEGGVSCDVTHTGEWSRRTDDEDSSGEKQKKAVNSDIQDENDGDTCPARF